MKTLRILGMAATITGLALVNSAANAVVIGTTEVGAFDEFKCAYTSANSSEAAEEAAIELCVGADVTYTKALSLANVTSINGDNFIDVSPLMPGFFLLKYGQGDDKTAEDIFIFANLADLNYFVWADSTIIANGAGTNNNGGLLGLSHYSYTGNVPNEPNSPNYPTPEPGTLALLGLGLLGLGGTRRFRRS